MEMRKWSKTLTISKCVKAGCASLFFCKSGEFCEELGDFWKMKDFPDSENLTNCNIAKSPNNVTDDLL